VRGARERLPHCFELLAHSATSILLKCTFSRIFGLLSCFGDTPIHHLYGKWVMISTPVVSLHQLQLCSPLDPSFPGLLRVCAQELAINFPLTVELIEKSMFNRASVPIARALSIIARLIKLDNYLPYLNTIMYTTACFSAVHLLCQLDTKPEWSNDKLSGIWASFIGITLLKESPIAAEHLFFFGQWLSLVPDDQAVRIINVLNEDLIGIEKIRVFLRMLLMVTSGSGLTQWMGNCPQFQQSFADSITKFLKEVK
jgi:hypothetical protein